MRALFRFVAYLILAGGVVMAVVDAIRSIANSKVEWTQLRQALALVAPENGFSEGGFMAMLLAAARDTVTGIALSAPVSALAAVLFVLIYALAARKRPQRHF
jgi:hypothetical protein